MYFNRGEIREQPSPKKVNVNHVVELKIQKTYTHTHGDRQPTQDAKSCCCCRRLIEVIVSQSVLGAYCLLSFIVYESNK